MTITSDVVSSHILKWQLSNVSSKPRRKLSRGNVTAPTNAFPFCKLPTELRNMVYEFALSVDSIPVCSPRRRQGSLEEWRNKPSAVALLAVNRQLYLEGSAKFYAINDFEFGNAAWGSTTRPNLRGFQKFTQCIPKPALALIRRITISVHFIGKLSCHFSTTEEPNVRQTFKDLERLAKSITTHFTCLQFLKMALPSHDAPGVENWDVVTKYDWGCGGITRSKVPQLKRFLSTFWASKINCIMAPVDTWSYYILNELRMESLIKGGADLKEAEGNDALICNKGYDPRDGNVWMHWAFTPQGGDNPSPECWSYLLEITKPNRGS